MLLRVDLLVDGVVFLDDGLGNASFPLRASIVHSVHELAVAPDVLRIGIGAVPVAVLRLFALLRLSFNQLAISQNVSAAVLKAAFFMVLDGDVAMQVHIDLAVNFVTHSLLKLVKSLALGIEHVLEFLVFFALDIFQVFEMTTAASCQELLLDGLSSLGQFADECIRECVDLLCVRLVLL